MQDAGPGAAGGKVVAADLGLRSLRGVRVPRGAAELDASGNRLRDVSGLGAAAAAGLRTLVLDGNELEDLRGLPQLDALETLWLNKNCVADLDALLDVVAARAPRVRYLSLLGNPACRHALVGSSDVEIARYRRKVLRRLPGLRFLDAAPVAPVGAAPAEGSIAKTVRRLLKAVGAALSVGVPPRRRRAASPPAVEDGWVVVDRRRRARAAGDQTAQPVVGLSRALSPPPVHSGLAFPQIAPGGAARPASLRELRPVGIGLATFRGLPLPDSPVEVLDVSCNCLASLDGLGSFAASLHVLVLNGNQLGSLDGLPFLPALETLHIERNGLASLPCALAALQARAPCLRDLSMRGNPVCRSAGAGVWDACEIASYRDTVARAVPSLRSLDGAPLAAPSDTDSDSVSMSDLVSVSSASDAASSAFESAPEPPIRGFAPIETGAAAVRRESCSRPCETTCGLHMGLTLQ